MLLCSSGCNGGAPCRSWDPRTSACGSSSCSVCACGEVRRCERGRAPSYHVLLSVPFCLVVVDRPASLRIRVYGLTCRRTHEEMQEVKKACMFCVGDDRSYIWVEVKAFCGSGAIVGIVNTDISADCMVHDQPRPRHTKNHCMAEVSRCDENQNKRNIKMLKTTP